MPPADYKNESFLKPAELEQLITDDKFLSADFIDDIHLLQFKTDGVLYLKVPKESNEKIPYDAYCWSKTKFTQDKKVMSRHQPLYKNISIFGVATKLVNCTEFSQNYIHKQVFEYNEYTYIHYFSTVPDDIRIPSQTNNFIPKKRLSENTKKVLRADILPHRTLPNAAKAAKDAGLVVTRRQIRNLARNAKDTVIGKSGPRSRTTLQMANELEKKHPGKVWFTYDSRNLLDEFSFVQIFEDSCRLYYQGCPTMDEWLDWQKIVDALKDSDSTTRKTEIAKLLEQTPSGLFLPSRLHVDTTFDLTDMFVTVVLGETANFKTKASGKPRVIPLAYMLHSKKSISHHERFATMLKETFDMFQNQPVPRKIPAILMDGETALEKYSEILDVQLIRCDLHILSLIRHNYGGNTAATAAKPFLFGAKVDGKWKAGILGSFDLKTFDSRLAKAEGKIQDTIFQWLKANRNVLMKSASIYAKLKGGHLLQYSTNNQNEAFNSVIKSNLSKRHNANELIRKLDECCQEKLKECWMSGIDGSELVFLTADVSKFEFDRKLEFFSSIGLPAAHALSLSIPVALAERCDLPRMSLEESKVLHLRLTSKSDNVFHITDFAAPQNDRAEKFVQVELSEGSLDCWKCGATVPHFLCSHVIFALTQLTKKQVRHYWSITLKASTTKKNNFNVGSGSKPSSRIGTKPSKKNYVRTLNDVSTLSLLSDCNDQNISANMTSPANSTQQTFPSSPMSTFIASPPSPVMNDTPSSSASNYSRRSVRKRKAARNFSPGQRASDRHSTELLSPVY